MRFSISGLAAVLLCAVSIPGGMQARAAFPDKPVHFIVGFAPGGGADTVARIVGRKLSTKWDQPVLVDNKEGADGSIAADYVAHAAPNGYITAWISNAHAITPSQIKLPYDPVKSFTPVMLAVYQPGVLVANPSVPVNSLNDLIALARQKPGELTFGSSGSGTAPHLDMELLMNLTGIKMVGVPYKGTAPALVGVVSGEVQVIFGSIATTLPQIKAKKLKALAVSGDARFALLPDVPTVEEAANLKGFRGGSWNGVLAPAGTPPEIVKQLNSDIAEVLRSPEVTKIMDDSGSIVIASSPEAFTETIKSDIAKFADLIKKTSAK